MKLFTSKILLFGEYTILNSGMALAIPFPIFFGKLVMPATNEMLNQKAISSNLSIKKWVKYLTEQKNFNNPPNEQKLLTDVLMGLFFDSNIPQSYGVGSSGALTAALYYQYFYNSGVNIKNHPIGMEELKTDLSLMESYFHGNSSGIDPLVSYLNEPVLIKKDQVAKHPIALPTNLKIFLIDTGNPATTDSLVQLFHKKMELPGLKHRLVELSSLTDLVIEAFYTGSISFEMIEDLSLLQQSVLKELFVLNKIVTDALHQFKGSFCVKLCGSGGGGFLLGFSKLDGYYEINRFLTNRGVSIIPIEL